ncbi:MAG: sulfite exporter TauE/SafE family protein [Sporichthyaceae bacterium]
MSTALGRRRSPGPAFVAGASVGVLGGMIGLGGAEFRLPILLLVFGFVALHAVVLNKAMSLVVVAAAIPARLAAVPPGSVAAQWDVALNLLAGSLVGAWVGATWAVRMRTAALYRLIAVLLVAIAIVLAAEHTGSVSHLALDPVPRAVAGVVFGTAIGIVAAVMGVAGGELLIPTLVLLYGLEVKLAGSVSLAVSLPTMLVAVARYSRDQSFGVLKANRHFVLIMALGSVAGAMLGGLLLGVVPETVLIPLLCGLLIASSCKVWRHT